MADRLRRQKDAIKKNISKFIESTTKDYVKYFEGSPTYVTYYQLHTLASIQDNSLETVHSLVGTNAPNKYKRIFDTVIYGVDGQDISNDIIERGFTSNVNGEFIMLPNSVTPYVGDFFSIDLPGYEEHLFRINEVQFDKISPKKFFRCQYNLYPDNADIILNNIEDDYELQYTEIGGEGSSIIKKSAALNAERTKNLVDDLISRYVESFYDDDMDSFVWTNDGQKYFWSPYLQKFLHDTKALTKFNVSLFEEIYIPDINKREFPKFFNESIYRNSIFRNIQTQNKDINFESNFIEASMVNVKTTRNLPFFQSQFDFYSIKPLENSDITFYTDAYPLFFNDVQFIDVPHTRKVHKFDDIHLSRLSDYLKKGDIVYECNKHELNITNVAIVEDISYGKVSIKDISLKSILEKENKLLDDNVLVKIIKDYLNESLELNDDLLKKINNYYYSDNIQEYILIPLVIYCLKKQMDDNLKI